MSPGFGNPANGPMDGSEQPSTAFVSHVLVYIKGLIS